METEIKCRTYDISADDLKKCLCKNDDNDKTINYFTMKNKTSSSKTHCTSEDPILNELKSRTNLLRCEIDDHFETTEKFEGLDPNVSERIYKLAATDLFVEKAISLLDRQARIYKYAGFTAFLLATIFILSGLISAAYQANIFNIAGIPHNALHVSNQEMTDFYTSKFSITSIKSNSPQPNAQITNENILKELISREVNMAWMDSLMTFMKTFTYYGLIVLIAVILKRFGKAVIDQAERLHDRRHALRQGRLYIHLKHGEITSVEELELAFNWNSSQSNAFADINTEAMAPWGNVLKEVLNMFPKAIEASNKK